MGGGVVVVGRSRSIVSFGLVWPFAFIFCIISDTHQADIALVKVAGVSSVYLYCVLIRGRQ